jgi:hypothetical protein
MDKKIHEQRMDESYSKIREIILSFICKINAYQTNGRLDTHIYADAVDDLMDIYRHASRLYNNSKPEK